MTTSTMTRQFTVVADCTSASDARVAASFATTEFFGTGRVVGTKTVSSMGTVVGWQVVVWARNDVGVDTSCVDCGTDHVHGRCARMSRR